MGAFVAAAVAVFARARCARRVAPAVGVMVLGWIAVPVATIGPVSWMQPATTIVGILVLVFAALVSQEAVRPAAAG